MTQKEVCEYIVKNKGDCGDINCEDCPFVNMETCYTKRVLQLAKEWLVKNRSIPKE